MITLDASVLIAHLSPADPHHEAATGVLVGAVPGSMLVHPLTLAEVLVGGVRVGRGAAMRDDLQSAGVVVVIQDADDPLRLAELRAGTGLRMPDCCVLDVAISQRTPLATFDLGLARVARHRGLVVVP